MMVRTKKTHTGTAKNTYVHIKRVKTLTDFMHETAEKETAFNVLRASINRFYE